MEKSSAKLARNPQLDGFSAKTAWRSMASAPNPGVEHLAALWIDKEVVIKVGSVYTTKHWRSESGDGYSLSDVLAWAPIPEWTGEVAE